MIHFLLLCGVDMMCKIGSDMVVSVDVKLDLHYIDVAIGQCNIAVYQKSWDSSDKLV